MVGRIGPRGRSPPRPVSIRRRSRTTRELQRGVHRSVKALNADIQDWIENWNEDPKPYVWTRTAEEILEKLAGYCNTINASVH
jgi:hypothetical protein